MSGVEHETSLEEQNSKIAGERSQHGDDDHSSHSPRVRAAIDAGRTQRELTHVPRMSAAAGVLKALKRPTQEATSGSGKKTRMSTENRARPSDAHKMPSSSIRTNRTTRANNAAIKLDAIPVKPSLIVKLRVLVLADSSIMKPDKPTRRSRRVKIKSEEFVASDIEDFNARDTGNLVVMDGNDDMTIVDASDTENKRTSRITTRSRTTPAKSNTTPPSPRSQTSNSTSWETASSSSSSSTLPSSRTTPPEPGHQSKSTFKSLTSPSTECTLPPFPKLPPPRRSPFHLGATIALSNILEDHVLYPNETLLELIEDLEHNQPTFERYDWEHRTVLRGGAWVCDVLREGAGFGRRGEAEAENEHGKSKVMSDEEADLVVLVKNLEKWVAQEWERVRPVEKVVANGEHEESEDDCGCGSRTPEVEDIERKKGRK